MPDTNGLPSGPVLQPNLNLTVPQSQGLTAGMVSGGVKNILNTAAGGTDLNVYNAVAKGGAATPTVPKFQANAPDPLAPIQSTLDAAITTGPKPTGALAAYTNPDPSVAGPIKAAANAVMTAMSSPVSTLSDAISRALPTWLPGSTLAQLDDLQKNFFKNHAGDLLNLDTDMQNAMTDVKGLSNLLTPQSMAQFGLSTGPLDNILRQKRQVGRDLSAELADAIANTDDPDEKARLQAEKNQVDAWQANCDQRIAQDATQINDLDHRLFDVTQAANKESAALMSIAQGSRPINTTSNNNAVVSTTHTQPGAVTFATGVRQALIQARVQMNTAMAGNPGN